MKLVSPNSPVVWKWLVLFITMTACIGLPCAAIIGAIIYETGASRFLWWIMSGPISVAAFMATMGVEIIAKDVERQKEQKRMVERTIGQHPEIGKYTSFPKALTWSFEAKCRLGWVIDAIGSGEAPSDEQVALWKRVNENIESLIATASAVLLPPPKPCKHASDTPITPYFMEILDNGEFEIYFNATAISDEINLGPSARFSASLSLLSAGWDP
jgi:hypothetical protein